MGNKIRKTCLLWILFSFIVITPATFSQSQDFSCRIIDLTKESCSGLNQKIVMRLSDLNNAHAELPSQSNYEYAVCCIVKNDELFVEESPINCYQGAVAALSDKTNAHVSTYDYTNYIHKICLSAGYGKVVCSTSSQACDQEWECLFSMSSTENAHVGNCSAYDTKLCCLYTYELGVQPIYNEIDGYLTVYEGMKARIVLKVVNPLDDSLSVTLALGSNTPQLLSSAYFSEHEHDEQRTRLSLHLRPHQSIYIPITVYGITEGVYDGYDGLYIHNGNGVSGAYATIPIKIIKQPAAETTAYPVPDIGIMQIIIILIMAAFLSSFKY